MRTTQNSINIYYLQFPKFFPRLHDATIGPWPMEFIYFLIIFTLRSIIFNVWFSNMVWLYSLISLKSVMWLGSRAYFWSWETWNTLCLWLNDGSSSKWYPTSPTLSKISKGPIYLGLNFPLFSNRMIPWVGDTFSKTWSPTSNSSGRCQMLAYDFCRLYTVNNLYRIKEIFSHVCTSRSGSTPINSHDSYQHKGYIVCQKALQRCHANRVVRDVIIGRLN